MTGRKKGTRRCVPASSTCSLGAVCRSPRCFLQAHCVTFELRQCGELHRAVVGAELRGALRALLLLRFAHRPPGEAVHFLRGGDGRRHGWARRQRRGARLSLEPYICIFISPGREGGKPGALLSEEEAGRQAGKTPDRRMGRGLRNGRGARGVNPAPPGARAGPGSNPDRPLIQYAQRGFQVRRALSGSGASREAGRRQQRVPNPTPRGARAGSS